MEIKYDPKKIKKLMEDLDISEEEAKDVIQYDWMVDHAKAKDVLPYDLTDEQKKVVKKMTNTGTRTKKTPTVYKFDKDKPKNRKANLTKAGLIQYLYEKIAEYGVENAEIVNKEGKISFKFDEKSFSLTLTQHRKA